MAEKILNARIVHKHDTELNWSKATNFIPKQGEIIVYDIDTTYAYERMKIGDGKTVVSALPFVDDAVLTKSKAYTDEKNEELSEGFSNVIYQMYGTDLTDAGAPTIRAIASDEADDALADAKAYTVSEIAEWVGDKTVSTQISTAIANKADSGHTHDDRYYTETEINTKLSAKADADHTHEISELTDLSGASVSHASTADSADEATHATTADTANAVAWANVTGKPSTYTPATHSHAISDVTDLQTTLNAKVPTSRTVNGKALSANITLSASDVGADTSGSANTALTNAKAYTDSEITEWVGDTKVSEQISTAIADKVDKVSGKGLSTNDYTTAEKNKLAGIAAGAEVNQNAFAKVTVGSTTIAADAESDALTLVAGNNVTITPDATNDKITIAATDTVYTHPTYTAKSSGLYKVTVDGTGHVSAATAVAKSDITALGIPAQDTTYSAATTSAAGLMSASDKSKLDGIASGANKITVDSALSSTSTNPVQNKAVNAAISNLNTLVGDTAVSTQISTAIAGLVDSSPDALNTLNELAAALGDDPNFATTVANQIGTKANASDLTSHTSNKSNPHGVSLSQLGVTATAAELNILDGVTATAAELNKLDGVTATTAELNYVDGVTSNIQTQLNAKVPTSRTVNGKALSANITLSASDVGADASGAANTALTSAKTYTDSEIQEWVGDTPVATQITNAVADKADKSEGAFFIEGSGTTDSTAKTSTWTGSSDRITSYYDGLTIRYKIGVAGQSTTTLNINDLGAKTVYRFGTSKLTTQFPVGSIVHLIYHADLNGGCWMCSDYDANTNTYQRVYESSAKNVEYPLTARYNTTTGSTYYAEYGRYSTGVTLNPSTNTITATAFKGSLTGNSDTATKATQDASGNVITSTYATKTELDTLVGDTPVADQIASAIADIPYATDEEIYAMMIEEEALPVIQTEDGSVLCSAENEILMI